MAIEKNMERPIFAFTTPFNVNVVEEKGIKRVFLEGLISTTDLDLVNDIVTKKCLESMQKQILSRVMKLDLQHEAFRGDTKEEKEINKTKIPIGKIIDATIVDLGDERWGLRVKSELNRFHKEFENTTGNIEEKYLDAYSIAFIPTKVAHVEKNGQRIRMLDDDRLLNVALTGNAVNTSALNEKILMKAMDAVEEYQKEKKNNPDLENQLEVKSYEKDGAHAHTEDEPLGLHNHPEVETMIRNLGEQINDRMNFLSDKLYDSLGNDSSESIMAIKAELTKDKQSRTQARNAAIAEGEEEDDDKKKKKKEYKSLTEEQKKFADDVIDYMGKRLKIKLTKEQKSKIHDHISDAKLNYRRLNMTEDKKDTSGKDADPEGEDAKPAEGEDKPAEGAEGSEGADGSDAGDGDAADAGDASAEGAEEGKELKEVNDRLEKTEKELEEIKAILAKPVHKSLAETKTPDAGVEVKEPLDAI